MKNKSTRKILRFGDVVESIYDACGRRRGRNIVRLAVNANVIIFCGQVRYVIS
jgi:hypothetical protein